MRSIRSKLKHIDCKFATHSQVQSHYKCETHSLQIWKTLNVNANCTQVVAQWKNEEEINNMLTLSGVVLLQHAQGSSDKPQVVYSYLHRIYIICGQWLEVLLNSWFNFKSSCIASRFK